MKKLKMAKYLILTISILSIIIVSATVFLDSEENSVYAIVPYTLVDLNLNNNSVTLSSEENSCVISGTTDAEYVTLNCPDLNIRNLKVNVENGIFSYEIKNIPILANALKNIEKLNYSEKDALNKKDITVNLTKVEVEAKSQDSLDDKKEYFTIKKTMSSSQIEEEFKKSCENISFNDLTERNPYNFKGLNTKYSGTVVNYKHYDYKDYDASYAKYAFSTLDLAIDGNRNQIIKLYYHGNNPMKNGDTPIEDGDKITVWCKIGGDDKYSQLDIEDWMSESGSFFTYTSVDGSDSMYNPFYTSLGDYKFNPYADVWYYS